jgi:uncharacterized SAM-dependent methyltransferase
MISDAASDVRLRSIQDIRQSKHEIGAREALVQGLISNPPRIPEFLLWDDKGLALFDIFVQTPTYYPFHSEIEIFQQYASEIVNNIPSGSAVIELGCG